MKRLIGLPLVCVIMILVTGCGPGDGDTHAKTADDLIQVMRDFESILKSVEDADTATAADEKIRGLGDRIEAIGQRFEVLGEPTAAEDRAFGGERLAEMDAIGVRVEAEIERIGEISPLLLLQLMDAVKEFGERMEASQPSWVDD